MNEQILPEPETAAQAQPEPDREPDALRAVLDRLEGLPDAALREIAGRARELLAAREKERRAVALREIQKIAKEHGLAVDVKDPKRRRGRPRKVPEGQG